MLSKWQDAIPDYVYGVKKVSHTFYRTPFFLLVSLSSASLLTSSLSTSLLPIHLVSDVSQARGVARKSWLTLLLRHAELQSRKELEGLISAVMKVRNESCPKVLTDTSFTPCRIDLDASPS